MEGVLSFPIFRTGKLRYCPSVGEFPGTTPEEAALSVIDSMDEDCIYRRIHPEDLVEKRLMEYKFFQKTFSMSPGERLKYRADADCV